MASTDIFHVEQSGGTLIVSPVGDISTLSSEMLNEAAEMMSELIESQELPLLVVDLMRVANCSSVFMSFLLRCHKAVKGRGGEMVLSSANKMMQELLSLTRLDTVWAVYQTRSEAVEALDG